MSSSNNKSILAQGRFLRLIAEDGWEYVQRVNASGVVVILAVTDAGEIILVEQFRRALKRRVIELPAGLVGDGMGQEAELFADAAKRELLEETGYAAKEMKLILEGPTSPGLCSETVQFFRAIGLTKVHAGGGDETEDIVVHIVPPQDIHPWLAKMTATGCLIDPKVYAGLYFCDPKISAS